MNWLIKSLVGYNVGFYDPSGFWIIYKTFDSDVEAERLVNYLNGGPGDNPPIPKPEKERIKRALLRRIK